MDKSIGLLVDEDFGLESKEYVNPRIRTGARGIVLNSEGKMAVFNKKNKNEFKLPGGGVEGDETVEEAFYRECLEETGCEVKIIKKLGTIEERKSLGNFIQISHVFVGEVVNELDHLNLTEKESEEGSEVVWVSLEEGLRLITDCYDNLKPSIYEDLYYTRFMIKRDQMILEYYLNNK